VGADRRLLLVHAHPDDETINHGATMARYVAQGAAVTLVTCTRGEEGEIIPPELAHLAAEGRLADHRGAELARAMSVLGVRDHRFLGEPDVAFADSGMAYDSRGHVVAAARHRPDAFALVPVDHAAALLAAVLREVRPQVVVTYEPGGGYGHPDHIQAHRVTMRAVDRAVSADQRLPGWAVPKVYWAVLPRSARGAVPAGGAAANPFSPPDPSVTPTMVVDDAEVTAAVDGRAFLAAKTSALRAHATQVQVRDGWFALSNGIGHPIGGVEYFRLVRGSPGGPRDAAGRESDLFGGLD
jgi:N-acetyl-1-D-myo-inositol-2-amino-2-deoxy-alpha-D-glucopyranoside deacetylase